AAGIAALLTIGARFVGGAVRPETFAVDAFALVLCLLPGRRSRWAAIPVVIVWANVHASVLLAPIVVAAFACIDVTLVPLAGATALATLVTPHGIGLWSYAVTLALAPSVERATLSAWRPLSFTDPGAVLAVVPGLAVLALCGVRLRRRRAGELLLAAFCL